MVAFLAWAALTVSVVAALHDEKFKPAYDTVLQRKCEVLKMKHQAAFVGDRCFAATNDRYKVKLDDWNTLNSKCVHINGYEAHMAHIWSEKQLDVLMEQDVLQNNERYFIGARQSPTDTEEKIPCCKDPKHSERWKYFDADNKIVGEMNGDLWLKDQPDNAGANPPELVVTLEKLNTSHKLGFNDANPEMNEFSVLCEYIDYLQCPDGWSLIGSDCYKVFTNELTYADAVKACEGEGLRVDAPKLAAVHEDSVNQNIALLARAALKDQRQSAKGDRSHNPVMFGLVYKNDAWEYDGGEDKVDFFRWYHKAGLGEPTPFAGRDTMVALLNTYPTGASGEARYTYWTVGNGKQDKFPFVCMGGPML